MKRWMGVLMIWIASTAWAGVPNRITYQGTLKEAGVPVNASRSMQFRLTNSNGTVVYWSSGNVPVNVTQGLFSTVLSPAGVDWPNIFPYIEVSVEGQLLLPREPVTATAYALTCGSVAEPSMIAMFAGGCPAGWTRFSALDGRFPMGGASFGPIGGNATHRHSLAITQTISGGGATVVG